MTAKKKTAKKATAKKTKVKKASPKKPAKKKKVTNKKTAKKKKGASYLAQGLTAKEMHAKAAKRPIVWNERRIAIVKALRSLKAVNGKYAVTADKVSTRAKIKDLTIKEVKRHCDVYRGTELVKHGYVVSTRREDSRELFYYLTDKGAKTDFTNKK